MGKCTSLEWCRSNGSQCLLVANDTGDEERQEEEILRGAHIVLGTSVDAVECPWQLEDMH